MAELDLVIDDSSFLEGTAVLQAKLEAARQKALRIVGDELLRLSQLEVPFVSGELLNSGVSQSAGLDDWVVGYNKVYAAYMHEGDWPDGSHRILHYSNNRKGKYLEDPMKLNKDIFTAFFGTTIKAELGIA